MHLEWIGTQKFDHEPQRRVLADHLQAVWDSTERVQRLDKDILEFVQTSSFYPAAEALQALRGVDLIAAATLLAEPGDLRRFDSPTRLMSYVGLVPTEHSSGNSRVRQPATNTGHAVPNPRISV
jgi:transposase